MLKEIKGHEQGKCPVCGSEEIEYGSMDLDGNNISYEFTCEKCGNHSFEWYEINYIETISKITNEKQQS